MKRTAIVIPLLCIVLAAGGCRTTQTAPSRLETTPRHDEWIQVAREGRNVRTYVVYPQVSDRAPVVILIHENRGLTDWVRTVADRLAEEGYIAIAPDFLSGMAPGGGGTREFASEDAAREAIGRLPAEQVRADLRSVVEEARGIPSASGEIFLAGFCWGGARAWEAANEIDGLRRVFVFYGTGPDDPEAVSGIDAPVFGFYGGNDARVNATIPKTEESMRAAGKRFEPVTYEGAGHAFMRLGEATDASEANARARAAAWERWLALLR